MATDWTELCEKFKGMWVGLEDDEKTVVASGATVKEVMDKAEQQGYENPLLFKVPLEIIPFIGAVLP